MNGRWIQLRDALWMAKAHSVILRTAFIGHGSVRVDRSVL